MPTFNRAEAQRRLDADDGDPEDLVIPVGEPGQKNCYHESTDCGHVVRTVGSVDDSDRQTRSEAQRQGYVPCKQCVLGTYSLEGSQALRLQLEDPEVTSADDIDWEAV